jgi:hypothetical protein
MITRLVEDQCFTKRVTKVLNVLEKASVCGIFFHWSMVFSGFWLLAVGCWLLAFGFWLLAIEVVV